MLLPAVLLGLALAEATVTVTNPARARILQRAYQHLQQPRRLAEQGFAISASQSLRFDTCISLTTELPDEMREALSTYDVMKDYYVAGEIVPIKSYVLFGVCEGSNTTCYYNEGDASSDLYMVDLPSYLGLFGYKPQQTIDYCDACADAMDFCL